MNLDGGLRRLDLSSRSRLVAAVSGGSDSTALLHLLKAFRDRHAPHLRLLAVTVDHGLRAESAAEAGAVGETCRSLGVEHRILRWEGEKPATGVIAAAREARYRLLARAAADFGAVCVLTGHTMDDQAETVAMRSRRGEGTGLAGMADATLYDGRVWIVRPLLGVRRQALRDHLATHGLNWIDDPTNADMAYERVRVRRALGEAGGVEALAATAAAAGAERRRLAAAAGELIERFAKCVSPGLYQVDRDLLVDVGGIAARLALRMLLATVGGTPYPPDEERAERLRGLLADGGAMRATLGRTVVDARGGGIWLRREARDVPTVAIDGSVLWDGRWRIDTAQAATVGPLGTEAAARLAADRQVCSEAPPSLVRAAMALEPALILPDGARHAANGREWATLGVSAVPVVAPHARFLPGFDLALAGPLRRLVGAPVLPPTPWKDHIDA